MGEDPYLVVDARRRLRPRPAERRRHRHPQALRRILRLPRGAQPRPGADGPARADGRHPAAVRDGGDAGRRRLGDELLLRRRRRARRRGPLAAHRPAARRVGVRRHRRLRLLGGAVPRDHAPGRRGRRRGRRAGADGRASTSSCRTPSASAPGSSSGCAAASCAEELVDRAARRLLTQKVAARPARPGLDAGGLGRPPRPAVDLDSPANRALAREMAERSIVLLDAGTALPLLGEGRPAAAPVAVVGPCADDPRTFMGCYAFPNHVLPAPPRPRARASRCRRVVDALRAELPGRRGASTSAGCAVQGDGPVRLRRRRRRGPRGRPVRRARRRPRRAVRPRHVRRGLRRRGPAAAGRAGGPARRAARDRHAGGRGGRLRPPVRARRRARPGRRPGAGVHARRGGRRGDRRRALRPGPAQRQAAGADPAAPGRAAGHLPAAAARRRERRHQQPSTRRRCSPSATARRTPRFEVDDLRVSDAEMPTDGEFTVSVTRPQHRRPGRRRRSSSSTCATSSPRSTRPVRQLAGFARVPLEPGEADDVRFRLHADRTAFTGRDAGAHRRAGRRRGARRHVRGRPAVPRHRPAHRAAARGRPRPAAGHAGASSAAARAGRREAVVAPRDRRTTLATVAASAGVSVATVSKVVNGRADVGADDPGAGRVPAASSTTTSGGDRPPAGGAATATVELIFAGDAQRATPSRSSRASSTPGRRSASPSPSACDRRGRGGPTASASARGPATWSPPGAGRSSP